MDFENVTIKDETKVKIAIIYTLGSAYISPITVSYRLFDSDLRHNLQWLERQIGHSV